ncbi:hypothetical protein HanRHA438_Chr17g0806341 [Helianthus annuus]|nr:hypothetical protein HanPSC8_Chr17g0764021 [Helianthus annuus]KAJ0825723.1 hypothetical protein HanRHA438_Chr17g0806341 [Helianthus annuus]
MIHANAEHKYPYDWRTKYPYQISFEKLLMKQFRIFFKPLNHDAWSRDKSDIFQSSPSK